MSRFLTLLLTFALSTGFMAVTATARQWTEHGKNPKRSVLAHHQRHERHHLRLHQRNERWLAHARGVERSTPARHQKKESLRLKHHQHRERILLRKNRLK